MRPLGIQLYSLKSFMEEDPWGTLKALSEMGYTHIESYEGPNGFFWGLSPLEFVNRLENWGLTLLGAHLDIFQQFEEKLSLAVTGKVPFLVCPWIGPSENPDFYKKALDRLMYCGNLCKQAGIRFLYHNHDYSFSKLKEWSPISYFLDQADPELLSFEMDIYWVYQAGEDPIKWLQKHPGRWPLFHLKDRHPSIEKETTIFGQGNIDYPTVLNHLEELDSKFYIIEQEHYHQFDPFDSMNQNAINFNQIFNRVKEK